MAIHASLKASPSLEFTGFTPFQIVRFSTGSLVMGPSSASAFGTVNW
jgi:hypothetical protein